MPSPSRGTTRRRAAAAGATLVLLALGAAYYLTYEPAPEVAVRWREGTTWQRRAELERRFGLVRARDIDDWKVWYDLVDIRPANIRSLAEEPDVAATQGLDLETYSIPPDGPYGKGWMWIGPRLPVLRHRGVVAGVILVCALTLALTLPPAFGAPWRGLRPTWPQLIAATVMATLGAAWYATRERAPAVSIGWREDVTPEHRRAIARRFRLANPREQDEGVANPVVYDLLDIRQSNVEDLVGQPEIADTARIDRARSAVPANAPFGRGHLWIGTRLPLLRTYGVVPALVVSCVIVLLYPVVRGRARRARDCVVGGSNAPPRAGER